jgi:hypothetical protein
VVHLLLQYLTLLSQLDPLVQQAQQDQLVRLAHKVSKVTQALLVRQVQLVQQDLKVSKVIQDQLAQLDRLGLLVLPAPELLLVVLLGSI